LTAAPERMALAAGIPHQHQALGWLRAWTPGFGLVVCICGYLVLMPSVNVLPDVVPYDTKRIGQVLLLLGFGLWLLFRHQAATQWLDTFNALPRLGRWGLGIVVALGVCSSMWAPLLHWALLEVAHLVLLGCLAVTIAAFCRRDAAMMQRLFLGALLLSIFLYLVNFAVSYSISLGTTRGGLWPWGVDIGFAHPRFLNQFQTWTLPLIVLPGLIWPIRNKAARFGLHLLAMGWWMLLFGSGGRGTTLAMATACLLVGIVYRKQAWPWLRAQGVAFLGGGLLYWLLFKMVVTSQSSLLDRSLTSGSLREVLWERAWLMVQQHPLLGVGPMHYAYQVEDLAAHPHNVVLQWAAEWGLPATLLITGLFLWGLLALVRCFKTHAAATSQQQVVQVALTASLVAAIGHALLSGITIMPLSQLAMVLITGWAWGLWLKSGTQAGYTPWRSSPWILRLIVAASLLGMVWGTSLYVLDLKHQQAIFKEAKQTTTFRPRFWQQGFIKFYD